MTATSVRYQLNRPSIIDELIDGEVVAVDLQRGTYYSIRGTGVEVWYRLATPTTPDAVADQVAERYGAEPGEVAATVKRFIDDLAAAGLLLEVEGDSSAATSGVELPAAGTAVFEPPLLEAFTDMEDLLMLDPIDDVDGRGWPHTRDRADPAP